MDLNVEDIKLLNQLEAHWRQARHLVCNLDKYSDSVYVSHYNQVQPEIQAWRERHHRNKFSLDSASQV